MSTSACCAPQVNGEFCETSVTNLHTHGLHVSSMGAGSDGYAKHSDNIFAKVLPNESTEYSFTIPDYHMGGTHWYFFKASKFKLL